MAADIDIDVSDRDQVLAIIKHIPARQASGDQVRRHNSGIYVNDIPYDPVNGCAAIDYQLAEQRGYVKIDLLNMSVYKMIKNQDNYDALMAQDPPWSRLWQDPAWTQQLVHVGNYSELLKDMRPDSIPRMAAFISVIRPGKAHLQRQPWSVIFESVWDGDDSRGYTFKKAHAVSYSMLVVLHMNILNQP